MVTGPTEWASTDPQVPLPLPEDLRARMRYRFTSGGPLAFTGLCENFMLVDPGWVKLENALCDTSERAHGIVLLKRVTLRAELWFQGVPVMLAALNEGERLRGD